ncbi:ABC transporter substrate-binding protein [Candidatus Bipolaricaulota sp. J31]
MVRRISAMFIAVLLVSAGTVGAAGTLRLAIHTDESTLTPFTYVFGYPGYYALKFIYDSLFELDRDNIPRPWLVEDYTVSDDGLVWTLRLREGVRWHDGEPFTADDVKFTYDYFRAHRHSRFTTPIARALERVEVVDAHTVRMYLKKPDPAFIFAPLADVPILPEHVWRGVEDPSGLTENVGTGPYRLVEYRPGQAYVLEGNPDYFKGEPYFDRIVMPIITEPSTLYTALKSGQVDAASMGLSPELVPQFTAVPGLKVVRGPGYALTLLQINNGRFPLDDKRFRQALAHAIDTQYLVDTVLLGYGTAALPGFFHPSSPWCNPDVPRYEGGPERAAAILEELGFLDRDGDGIREAPDGSALSLEILVYSGRPLRIRTAEIISSWLAEAGLRAPVRALDAATVDSLVWPEFDVRKGRDYDLAMWGWSAPLQFNPWKPLLLFHSDPDVGVLNIGGYSNPEVDALIEELYVTTDMEAVREKVFRLQELVAEDVPFIPLYFADGIYAYWPEAHDRWVFVKGVGIFNKLSLVALEG